MSINVSWTYSLYIQWICFALIVDSTHMIKNGHIHTRVLCSFMYFDHMAFMVSSLTDLFSLDITMYSHIFLRNKNI